MVHLVYAAATNGRQSLNNEAKNGPVGMPQVARSLPSATGWKTLGQEGAIIIGCENIDLPVKHSPAEMTILKDATAYDSGDVAWVAEESKKESFDARKTYAPRSHTKWLSSPSRDLASIWTTFL